MAKRKKRIQTWDNVDYLYSDELFHGYFYKMAELEKVSKSSFYAGPVIQMLLDCFAVLAGSRERRLRLADFPVSWGDYFAHFIIGLSTRITDEAKEVMDGILTSPPYFEYSAIANEKYNLIIPWGRYQKGQVIVYDGNVDADGTSCIRSDIRTKLTLISRNQSRSDRWDK